MAKEGKSQEASAEAGDGWSSLRGSHAQETNEESNASERCRQYARHLWRDAERDVSTSGQGLVSLCVFVWGRRSNNE